MRKALSVWPPKVQTICNRNSFLDISGVRTLALLGVAAYLSSRDAEVLRTRLQNQSGLTNLAAEVLGLNDTERARIQDLERTAWNRAMGAGFFGVASVCLMTRSGKAQKLFPTSPG
jgi:hypothetical protein